MKIELSEKEVELHIRAIEENINYWMFESDAAEEYAIELCSSILLLEKMVNKDYEFTGHTWINGKAYSIHELKEEVISLMTEYLSSDYGNDDQTVMNNLKAVKELFGFQD